MKTFQELLDLDLSKFVQQLEVGKDRNGNPVSFGYLSWATAVKEANIEDPEFEFDWLTTKDEKGRETHAFEDNFGVHVKVAVVFNKRRLTLSLPLMSDRNDALKSQPYNYTITPKGRPSYTIEVPAADSMDINNTLMRCTVKAIAMVSGIGLACYMKDFSDSSYKKTSSNQPEVTHFYIVKSTFFNDKEKDELKSLGFKCDLRKDDKGQWLGSGIRYLGASELVTPVVSFKPSFVQVTQAELDDFKKMSQNDIKAVFTNSDDYLAKEQNFKIVK